MTKRKILTILFAFSLTLFTLGGCSNKQDSANTETSTSQEDSTDNITSQNDTKNSSDSTSSNQKTEGTSKENTDSKSSDLSNNSQDKKKSAKSDAVSKILKSELNNQQIPKYFIPVKAVNNNYNNLEKVNESNAFLCNDDNKLDNGVIVELPEFNENNNDNSFTIRNCDAIKNGGNGLIDKGTISINGEVKFSR